MILLKRRTLRILHLLRTYHYPRLHSMSDVFEREEAVRCFFSLVRADESEWLTSTSTATIAAAAFGPLGY